MEWLLRRARLEDDKPLADLALKEGRIAAIGPDLAVTAAETWDLEGRVVLPGLVEAHTHLDKTYTSIHNRSGTLLEAIELWRATKKQRTPADLQAAVRRALQAAVVNGVTAMRSHVDIEDRDDLLTLETLLELREQLRAVIDLQFVALGWPAGTLENRAAFESALAMGADFAGGAPALSSDPWQTIETTFALAERLDKPVDLHIDETEDPQNLTLAYLAEQTLARGMQGLVTAGHCCSLGFVEAARASEIIEKVAKARLNIVTLPSCNLVLMGRGIQPVPRGITPVKALLAAGVNVSVASDNVHDPFNPFGAYDLLQMANLNAHVSHMSGEAELYTNLAMVTTHPARTLGLSDYGLVEGAVADLGVVDAYRVLECITSPPVRLATFKAGKLVVRSELTRSWYASDLIGSGG